MKVEKKMEKVRFEKFYSLLFISLFLFVFHSNILLSFCSEKEIAADEKL